jgi:O-succinylbenzoate synthase
VVLKIEALELRELEMPLQHPFETSFGRVTHREMLIVTLRSVGLEGYGEIPVARRPHYSEETTRTAWHVVEDFMAPAVAGGDFRSAEGLLSAFRFVRGHNMARAGIEAAFWDLLAKRSGVGLSELLGGVRNAIPAGVSIGVQRDPDELIERIRVFLGRGYRRVKLKIKPGWDVDVVGRVREVFPEIALMVDANGAYRIEDGALFEGLDRFELQAVEQPLAHDDLVDHAALQRRLRTPICLDERLKGLGDLRAALSLGSCRMINVKPGRLGGVAETLKVLDLCRREGVAFFCGGMLESGIGRAHLLALSSLPGFQIPGDVSAGDRYYAEDIVRPAIALSPDGTIPVPEGPGIGAEIHGERLDRYTRRRKVFP